VQFALPKILGEVPESHFEGLKSKLKEASMTAFERLSKIKGVTPIKSSAAMYMMVRIDLDLLTDIADDVDFCKKLLAD
jgi:aspartate/methionine/tyrosine aminotransferase